MNRKLSFLTACLLMTLTVQGQYTADVDWDPHPVLHSISPEAANESAVFILDTRRLEYKYVDQLPYIFRTVHYIVKVLDEKGIESFNKMELPAANMEKVKARVILPNGKVNEVSQDKITRTRSEKGGDALVFAMEGMEKNAEVELLYTEKKPFAVFGTEQLQYNVPTVKAEFILVAPQGLRFETKGYNGFPSANDTLVGMKHFYYSVKENINGLLDEQYANTEAYYMRESYRLAYLENKNPGVRMFTWDDLARQMYEQYYNTTQKEKKVAEKYIKSLGIADADSEEAKIRKIEDGLKSNIVISDDISDESYLKFDKIVDKKLTTEQGFIRFFLGCLQAAHIDHQYGVTTNRFRYPFDEHFEAWHLLDISVIYFPKEKKYLAPSAVFYRMPFLPAGAINNKGVFLKTTSLGNMVSAVASIRTIPPLPIEMTNSDIYANIDLGKEMEPEVAITYTYNGYIANGLREAFVFTPKEKQKELVKSIIDIAEREEDIASYKIENEAFVNYYENIPLKVTADIHTPQLLEKAGPKYLLKVGDVIGRQVEMYQEKERKLPIELPYPHTMHRTITVNIPDGYKISNPEAVKIFADHTLQDGKETMAFKSDYTMDGNKMEITVKEFYDQLNYPKSDIEVFKKVINAAADFNKVVLVLEKI